MYNLSRQLITDRDVKNFQMGVALMKQQKNNAAEPNMPARWQVRMGVCFSIPLLCDECMTVRIFKR